MFGKVWESRPPSLGNSLLAGEERLTKKRLAVSRPLPTVECDRAQRESRRGTANVGSLSLVVLLPEHKAFQRIELRQAEIVEDLCRVQVAILGALPELTTVDAAGEHGPVLLRLMAENG